MGGGEGLRWHERRRASMCVCVPQHQDATTQSKDKKREGRGEAGSELSAEEETAWRRKAWRRRTHQRRDGGRGVGREHGVEASHKKRKQDRMPCRGEEWVGPVGEVVREGGGKGGGTHLHKHTRTQTRQEKKRKQARHGNTTRWMRKRHRVHTERESTARELPPVGPSTHTDVHTPRARGSMYASFRLFSSPSKL